MSFFMLFSICASYCTLSYNDKLVRQIIECIVVESKEKIKVVFIGGTEIEMTL